MFALRGLFGLSRVIPPMSSPYTIRIFVPEGDPNGLRIIENMNWTGTGVAFPRDKWASALKHGDIKKPGIYILWGYSNSAEDPRPRVYIGEGDNVSDRIDSHLEHKDFWGNAIVFTSNNLNKAYIRYIESMLITRAKKYKRCVVENGTEPSKPPMTASDCADADGFLAQMLRILPLVDLNVFEEPKAHVVAKSESVTPASVAAALSPASSAAVSAAPQDDDLVIVVPCREEGFNNVFLGDNCWYYVSIAPGKVEQIKWCASYQVAPVSAVTYVAPVSRIELFGEHGEYKILFASPAVKLREPIIYGSTKPGSMQRPRYTSLGNLKAAKEVGDLVV